VAPEVPIGLQLLDGPYGGGILFGDAHVRDCSRWQLLNPVVTIWNERGILVARGRANLEPGVAQPACRASFSVVVPSADMYAVELGPAWAVGRPPGDTFPGPGEGPDESSIGCCVRGSP